MCMRAPLDGTPRRQRTPFLLKAHVERNSSAAEHSDSRTTYRCHVAALAGKERLDAVDQRRAPPAVEDAEEMPQRPQSVTDYLRRVLVGSPRSASPDVPSLTPTSSSHSGAPAASELTDEKNGADITIRMRRFACCPNVDCLEQRASPTEDRSTTSAALHAHGASSPTRAIDTHRLTLRRFPYR
jgi:hypothetical protein